MELRIKLSVGRVDRNQLRQYLEMKWKPLNREPMRGERANIRGEGQELDAAGVKGSCGQGDQVERGSKWERAEIIKWIT